MGLGRRDGGLADLQELRGIDVYSCELNPSAAAEQRSNELVQRWLPKRTNFSIHGPDDLDAISRQIHKGSRRSLQWDPPIDSCQIVRERCLGNYVIVRK